MQKIGSHLNPLIWINIICYSPSLQFHKETRKEGWPIIDAWFAWYKIKEFSLYILIQLHIFFIPSSFFCNYKERSLDKTNKNFPQLNDFICVWMSTAPLKTYIRNL